jgi:cytochrome b
MLDRPRRKGSGVRVWDPLVRVAHWLLVASVTAAWLTRHASGAWHEVLGYAVLGVVTVRLAWGFVGSRHARFADFVVGPAGTLCYARQTLRRQERRYLGHNPLGAWMIVALIVTLLVISVSGWLYTTDRFWGVAWVEMIHGKATDVLLLLVALHVAGVLYASWRHRENLVVAMLHGRKRGLEPSAATEPQITKGPADVLRL